MAKDQDQHAEGPCSCVRTRREQYTKQSCEQHTDGKFATTHWKQRICKEALNRHPGHNDRRAERVHPRQFCECIAEEVVTRK